MQADKLFSLLWIYSPLPYVSGVHLVGIFAYIDFFHKILLNFLAVKTFFLLAKNGITQSFQNYQMIIQHNALKMAIVADI